MIAFSVVSQQSISRDHCFKLQFGSSFKHPFCSPCLKLSSSISGQRLLGNPAAICSSHTSRGQCFIYHHLNASKDLGDTSLILYRLCQSSQVKAAQADVFRIPLYLTCTGTEDVCHYHRLREPSLRLQFAVSLRSPFPRGRSSSPFPNLCVNAEVLMCVTPGKQACP